MVVVTVIFIVVVTAAAAAGTTFGCGCLGTVGVGGKGGGWASIAVQGFRSRL